MSKISRWHRQNEELFSITLYDFLPIYVDNVRFVKPCEMLYGFYRFIIKRKVDHTFFN